MRSFLKDPMVIFIFCILAYQSLSTSGFGDPMGWLIGKLIILPGIMIGLSFHEFAHAKVAHWLGDDTAKLQGRVTVNPAAHLDPMGLLALFFIGFGWGKPVPVNPNNFKHLRRDDFLVSIAGVTMNFILAVLFMGILRLGVQFAPQFWHTLAGEIVTTMLIAVVRINLVLMVFNLLPVPPLDGFNVVTEVFDLRKYDFYYRIYDKGFVLLLVLILFKIPSKVLAPGVEYLSSFLFKLFFGFS